MKKALPVVIIIAALGISGWMLFGKGKPVSGPAQEGESFTGKIKEAILRAVPMKCTWQDDKGNSTTGYIKGDNYYGEATGEGKTGYLIMKDDCMWIWNRGENQGVKTCFKPTEEEESIWETENAPQENYHCVPAVVSDSIFNLPTDVNFIDMEEMLKFGE